MILSAVAFASFLCEGSASDWSGDYLNRVVGAGPTVAALSYVPFTAVMAVTRLGGPRLYERVSIRWLLPSLALFAAAGLCVTLVTANLVVTLLGFAALGAGVALLVPAAMTAAYSPIDAGTAIAVVAAIGWVGYLIGPPLIGQVAQWAGLSAALATVPIMMTLVAIESASPTRLTQPTHFRSRRPALISGRSPIVGPPAFKSRVVLIPMPVDLAGHGICSTLDRNHHPKPHRVRQHVELWNGFRRQARIDQRRSDVMVAAHHPDQVAVEHRPL